METLECKKITLGLKYSRHDTVDMSLCPYFLSLGGLLWEETFMVLLSFYTSDSAHAFSHLM